jgi:small subunit ribosomal protein S30
MHLLRIHRTFSKLKNTLSRCNSQAALLDQNEYTETPEYPPILDMSLAARQKRQRETLFEKIRNINTVEEKQIALNMPRYYGWKCVMFKEDRIPYNAMPLVQCYTRSHFITVDKLPDSYAETSAAAEEISKEIKTYIEDAILMELDGVA